MLYAEVQRTNGSRVELGDADFANYARVIALLEHAGHLRGQRVLGRQHPLALRLADPTYVLYMAGLFENPDAMGMLVERVDSGSFGTWLHGDALASEYKVPLPVVRAVFELYASRGLGLLSDEIGRLSYMCKA